jgi:hypothetical protein
MVALLGDEEKKERREFSQCHRITSDTSSMLSILLVLGVDERPEVVLQVLGRKRKQRQLGYWSIYSASLLKSIICPLFVMYSTCSSTLLYHLLLLQYYILYSVTCLYRRFYWWCAARVELPLFRSYLLRISREILLARIFYCVGGFT